MMIKAIPLYLSSLYSPSSSFLRMVRKPTKRIMENLRSWDPLNSQLPDQEQESVKRTTWTPGEEILFWFGFHSDFDLCLPAKVKKRREAPLRREQQQRHWSDDSIGNSPRAGSWQGVGKVPALEEAATAALVQAAVLARVAPRWQSSSVKCAGGWEDRQWPWQRQRRWWGELYDGRNLVQ